MATSDWSDFLAVDWLTMEHISILLPPNYMYFLKKQKLLTLREAHEFTVEDRQNSQNGMAEREWI
jgi:hypothetical protein